MSRIDRNFYVRRYLSRALIVGVAMMAAGIVAIAQETREVYSATAMSTGGPRTAPFAGRLTFSIDRWTTAEDAQKLAAVLKKRSSKDVVEVLHDLKQVGRISSPGEIGYPLQYAVQDTLPDGTRQIVLMTDRPLSFAELWSQPITVNYPVTYIELKVDKEGKGTGKMSVATKLIPTRKLLVVEDWDVAPIQLSDVKRQR